MTKPVSSRLPLFTQNRVLPTGDYSLTLAQLKTSILVTGPPNRSATWDEPWRSALVDNLTSVVHNLWLANIDEIYVDGSFVESKDHPNDIDGYFICGALDLFNGELEKRLNQHNIHKCWTWDPAKLQVDANSQKRHYPMWNIYHVEMFPEYGQYSAIPDRFGNRQKFPAAFRTCRDTYTPKGIVRIVRDQAKGNEQ